MTRTLREISPVVRASQSHIDNWMSRVEMRTDFETPVRGAPRRYTRANTLELALISAMVQVGAKPSTAVAFADAYNGESGRLEMMAGREWLVFVAGDLKHARATDNPDPRFWTRELNAPALSIIHVGAIVREVDSLFTESV